MGEDLARIFDQTVNLPGVLVFDGSLLAGMVPRNRFFEQLGRPFGTEIFLHRTVGELLQHLNLEILVIPISTPINEAVKMAFARPEGQRYDPIIAWMNEKKICIIDMHSLLLALSNTYENMNIIISKQMEIGGALSSAIDTPHLLSLILQQVQEILPCHASAIYLEKDYGQQLEAYLSIVDSKKTTSFFMELKENINGNSNDKLSVPFVTEINSESLLSDPVPCEGSSISCLFFPLFYSHSRLGNIYMVRFNDGFYTKNDPSKKKSSSTVLAPFSEIDIRNMMGLESIISTSIRNSHLIAQIRNLANTDYLTRIYNRRGFFLQARSEMKKARNENCVLCALIIDIDHFKEVNDSFGHASGDAVIRTIVTETRKTLRSTDLIGRYGGEEFVILLPDSELDTAIAVAERIRRNIAALQMTTKTGVIKVTVSIGISQLEKTIENLDELLLRADQALNVAKANGRNQIMIWNKDLSWHCSSGATTSRKEKSAGTPAGIHRSSSLNDEDIQSLQDAIDDLIDGYVHALELRDKETEGHAQRVANLTIPLAKKIGFQADDLINIRRGCLLHDIGKIAIPDDILLKPGPLTSVERMIMERHPRYAFDLLSTNIILKDYVEIPFNHHEHWDGSGYPRHLKGEEIPLAARIFTLVDVWDALLSDRPYRKAWSAQQVLDFIPSQSGKLFDPMVVEIFSKFMQNDLKKGKYQTNRR
ncbi:MAG: diguanylate cyclase [Anaerolineaceae bacterium]